MKCGHKRRFIPSQTLHEGMRWWKCPVDVCTHGNWRNDTFHPPPQVST